MVWAPIIICLTAIAAPLTSDDAKAATAASTSTTQTTRAHPPSRRPLRKRPNHPPLRCPRTNNRPGFKGKPGPRQNSRKATRAAQIQEENDEAGCQGRQVEPRCRCACPHPGRNEEAAERLFAGTRRLDRRSLWRRFRLVRPPALAKDHVLRPPCARAVLRVRRRLLRKHGRRRSLDPRHARAQAQRLWPSSSLRSSR